MTKKKKLLNQTTSSACSSPGLNLNLELDNKALRAKNSQLVQTVAKLQQEKAQQQDQISSLQEEYFKLNSKFLNLKNIFSTIDSASKQWLTKCVDLSEMCTKIMQLCSLGMTVTNFNRDSRTQRVKPQIVNGHILHNPTITLSRLSDASRTPPRRHSNQNSPQRHSVLPKPSTSRMNDEEEDGDDDDDDDQVQQDNDQYEDDNRQYRDDSDQENEFVNRDERRYYSRGPRRSRSSEPLHLDNMQQEDDPEMDVSESEEDPNDEDFCPRLITIQKEEEEEEETETYASLNSSKIYAERVREVRIYIDPLPKDCFNITRNTNSSKKSISIMSNSSPMKHSIGEATSPRMSRNVSLALSPIKRRAMSNKKSNCFHDSSTFTEGTSNNSEISSLVNDMFVANSRFSEHLSTIHNVPSCSTPCTDENCSNFDVLNNSKEDVMRSLGLEPSLHLTTSTPLVEENSARRDRKKNCRLADDSSSTPRLSKQSNVNKRRRKSNNKVAQVILKRLSLEKRLSGSPIKKIGEALDSTIITNISDIKRKSGRFSQEDVVSTNIETGQDKVNRRSVHQKQKSTNKDKQVKNPVKKVQTRLLLPSPQKVKKMSPRPKRAARPAVSLKERSLNKKLRRSK